MLVTVYIMLPFNLLMAKFFVFQIFIRLKLCLAHTIHSFKLMKIMWICQIGGFFPVMMHILQSKAVVFGVMRCSTIIVVISVINPSSMLSAGTVFRHQK